MRNMKWYLFIVVILRYFGAVFSREFKDVCERMGKVYDMTLKIMPRFLQMGCFKGKGITLQFPSDANLSCFQTTKKRCLDSSKIEEELENITWLGNNFERLGID